MRIMNSPGRKTARRLRAAIRLREAVAALKTKHTLSDDQQSLLKKKEEELATLNSRMMSPEVAGNTKNKKYRGPR